VLPVKTIYRHNNESKVIAEYISVLVGVDVRKLSNRSETDGSQVLLDSVVVGCFIINIRIIKMFTYADIQEIATSSK